MNVLNVSRELLKSTQTYLDMLKSFSLEEFQINPKDGAWSYSEVYSHIIQVNTVSLLAIEKCLHGKQVTASGSLPILSRLILLFGKFPPVRIKAPDNIASSVKKISIEEASNGLIKLISRIEAITPKVSKITSSCKIHHPRLGPLNSVQWFRFMEIHNNHHLKQIERIRKSLSKKSW